MPHSKYRPLTPGEFPAFDPTGPVPIPPRQRALPLTATKLTSSEFNALCGELLIDPGIALGSDAVRDALANGGDVREVLLNEF